MKVNRFHRQARKERIGDQTRKGVLGDSWHKSDYNTKQKIQQLVYPDVTQLRVANPVHGTINFISSSEPLNYDLLDGTGKRLLTSNTIEKIDVSSYSPGVYYLSFKGHYGNITKRIVIE